MRYNLFVFVLLVALGSLHRSVSAGNPMSLGCSLQLDGTTHIALDRFVTSIEEQNSEHFRDMGVHADLAHLTIETWVNPSRYTISTEQNNNKNEQTMGVIIQTGIIRTNDNHRSVVVKYDYVHSRVVVELWTKHEDKWNYFTLSSPFESVKPNVWTHVAFSILLEQLHINGHLVQLSPSKTPSMQPPSTELARPSWRFAIGANFTGNIDEVRVWNISLSSSDITSNMPRAVCPTLWRGALLVYLNFDECSGNVTLDYGYGHGCGRMRSNYKCSKNGNHQKSPRVAADKHPIPLFLVDVSMGPIGNNEVNSNWENHKFHMRPKQIRHQIVYGPSAPIGSVMCKSALASASAQCPYQTKVDPIHSDSDSYIDVIVVDTGFAYNFLWMVFLFVTVCLCSRCCRRRARKVDSSKGYQQLPQSESEGAEFNGYPGAYFAVPPQQSEPPVEQQQVPNHMGYAQDPRMYYMYYMPQMQYPRPVYYSPNQPWADQETEGV